VISSRTVSTFLSRHDLYERLRARGLVELERALSDLGDRVYKKSGRVKSAYSFVMKAEQRGMWRSLSEMTDIVGLRAVRSRLADRVIYQSDFSRETWESEYGVAEVPARVVYNGVDLKAFNPDGPRQNSRAKVCILNVEGRQGNDPFDIALNSAEDLRDAGVDVELALVGNGPDHFRERMTAYPFVTYHGAVSHESLPALYRAADLVILTDIYTAGCPNSAIESLACGSPLLGFRVGPFGEIVTSSTGRCVEYGGDPWKGNPPGNRAGFRDAALEILADLPRFRAGARRVAEDRFGLDEMVASYIDALLG